MIKVLGLIWRYNALRYANIIIYSLQKLPWIGKKVPNRFYRADNKDLLYWLGAIGRLLLNPFQKILYLVIMMGLVNYGFQMMFDLNPSLEHVRDLAIHSFIWISLFGGIIPRLVTMENRSRTDYELVKLAGLDAKQYYLARILENLLNNSVILLLAMFIIDAFFPIGLSTISTLFALHVSFRLIGEAVFLWLFQRFSYDPLEHDWHVFVLMFAPLFLAYLLPLVLPSIDYMYVLLSPYVVIPLLLLGVASVYFLAKASYQTLANHKINLIALEKTQSAKKEMQLAGGRVREKDISLAVPADKLSGKTGYVYLHQLFYSRYHKVMYRSLRSRLLAYTVLFVVIMVMGYFTQAELQEKFASIVNMLIRASFYFFYFFGSYGERFTKLLFLNMDLHLLPYNFYREPEGVAQLLRLRFLKLLQLGFLPTLLLVVYFIIWGVTYTGTTYLMELGLLSLVFIILSLFFSLHHLIIYHTFQPYNQNMEVKHNLSRFISVVIYIITFTLWQLKDIPNFVYIIVLIVMVIYTVVGLQLMKKLAPLNFKLKQ